MGLRVQLGHQHDDCVNPERASKKFLVLDVHGMHPITADWCGCDKHTSKTTQILQVGWFPATVHNPATCAMMEMLRHFHGLTLSGKVAVYPYYLNLERMTDPLGTLGFKSRYKALMRMTHQWSHLKLLKRKGRGNVMNSVATTRPGDLATPCAACPSSVNLPSTWLDAPEEDSYLYRPILAIDANFRLKNCMQLTEARDPGLHTGLAYFVEQKPYRQHILDNAYQSEISSCSGFNALSHAESKGGLGLRFTGVGMCICARHEMIRPLGVGDLDKSEKYCHMDFIACSAARPHTYNSLMLVYDIACQWKVNFPSRNTNLPSNLQIPSHIDLDFAIPKCHCPAHKPSCQTPHSLNLKPGAGRTDGEGIKRDWSSLNHVANSTKEMGPGARHDTLDGHFDYHNWRKTVNLGSSLLQKVVVATAQAKRQTALHVDFTEGLREGLAEALDNREWDKDWTNMVKAWEKDKDEPNPYLMAATHTTENDVWYQLIEEERLEQEEHASVIKDTTVSGFLANGLLLEESQRRLAADAAAKGLSKHETTILQKRRIVLQKELRKFRDKQRIFMPGIDSYREQSDQPTAKEPERELLWLPSSLPEHQRARFGGPDLAKKEAKLREAQCLDGLERIRSTQRARAQFAMFKHKNVRGQKASTRARTTLDVFAQKIDLAAEKYRTARKALLKLLGPGDSESDPTDGDSALNWELRLQPLNKDDIRPPLIFDIDKDDTVAALTEGGHPGARKKIKLSDAAKLLGEGTREVPWIWRVLTGSSTSDPNSAEPLRVEWCKSRARACRWTEESHWIKEEMRCVRRTLEFRKTWWMARSSGWPGIQDPVLIEGITAYVHRQADVQGTLRNHFSALWEASVKTKRPARARPVKDLPWWKLAKQKQRAG
ncbi:hypothetical protein HGRIS_001647 [Hohenbuehelia grisea]|uniref:CxC2-like cysteine cluster KDZ transposase-associated domain-containing protein n=1 Tax=Hohenbuehelia grisea TaxID=104357 RepID=A0ABR3JI13_9AGAR